MCHCPIMNQSFNVNQNIDQSPNAIWTGILIWLLCQETRYFRTEVLLILRHALFSVFYNKYKGFILFYRMFTESNNSIFKPKYKGHNSFQDVISHHRSTILISNSLQQKSSVVAVKKRHKSPFMKFFNRHQ